MRTVFLSLMFFSALFVFGQQRSKPIPVFPEKVYNFGVIPESAGKVTHSFEFSNQGDAPLVIQQVIASCGCTTPVWPKEPIPPGGKGAIQVTYSTYDRPGTFNKTIVIYNNSTINPVTLIIKGEVTQKPLSIEQMYPQEMGPLRLKSRYLSFGNVSPNETKTEQMLILNPTKKVVEVALGKLPPYLKGVVVPSVMQPNSEAAVIFSLNSAMLHDWGLHSDEVTLMIDRHADLSKSNVLTLTANRMEDFSKMTPEEKKNAPIVVLTPSEVKLNVVKQNIMSRGTFTVKNEGRSPLYLLKAFADCHCIRVTLPKRAIAPHQSVVIHFEVATGITQGPRFETINLITNAPASPSIPVHVSWETVK
ncbi:MAG: DUF1573 domain-containing protein [Microbacter sp.]